MIDDVTIHRGSYHDSARLMSISRELATLPGIQEAVVLMGTEANRALLEGAGFGPEELGSPTAVDLVVALRSESAEGIASAHERLRHLLSGREDRRACSALPERPRSIREAVRAHPAANLVSVAVPGPYAAFVADRALDEGRNVFLFSDNVSLEDEVALKLRARELGLLVMGPDCGTAIFSGVGLGFANRVDRGPVGIVGASGTGIQEVCCLLDRLGVGISHAIGTGSRDLSAGVGGAMTEVAVRLLSEDTGTGCLVLVAKHPDPLVAGEMHTLLAGIVEHGKPVVVRYLGEKRRPAADGVIYAGSLDEAAETAARWSGGTSALPASGARRPEAARGRLVGLFGGGSLAAEARLFLAEEGIPSSVPRSALREGMLPAGHLIVDTGDDVYTVGRPHPMVDQGTRCGLIRWVGADPTVGVLLIDLVLGDGAHPDPAPEIVAAVAEARRSRGPVPLAVIASVSGTRRDPQSRSGQEAALMAGDIHVEPTAALAARAAARALAERNGEGGR